MKPPSSPGEGNHFSGKVRYYHRNQFTQRTWDDWVEGSGGKKPSKRNWLAIISSLIGLLILAGIITGLVIELR